jgi:hypothetical protein
MYYLILNSILLVSNFLEGRFRSSARLPNEKDLNLCGIASPMYLRVSELLTTGMHILRPRLYCTHS